MPGMGVILGGATRRAAVCAAARMAAVAVFLLMAGMLTMGPAQPMAHSPQYRKEAHYRDQRLYQQPAEQQQRQAVDGPARVEEVEIDVDDTGSSVQMVIGRAVASLAVAMRESSLFARNLEREKRNLERARHRLLTNSSASEGRGIDEVVRQQQS